MYTIRPRASHSSPDRSLYRYGQGSGLDSYICDGLTSGGIVAVTISAQGQEDGTVTGSVNVQIPEGATPLTQLVAEPQTEIHLV